MSTSPVASAPRWRTGTSRALSSDLAPILGALVAAAVVLSVLSDAFLTSTNLTNVVTQSAVVGIAAVGATFVIITSGIDLSVGSTMALSGFVGAQWAHSSGNGWLGLLAVLVISLLIGAFNGVSVAWLGLAPFIVTLAVMGMARGLTLQLSQGQSVYDLPGSLNWLGSGAIAGIKVSALVLLLVFAVGHLVLRHTTFGHQVYAVGGNADAARLAGIAVKRVVCTTYVIAALCAAVAAVVLVGRLDSATPNAATGIELQVIAAVVIGGTSLFGGKGSMVGTLVGVLLIGVINNGLTLLDVSSFWVQFVQGLLIFLAVLLDSFNTGRLKRAATS